MFRIIHASAFLRGAGANPSCLPVRGDVHPNEHRASFYITVSNRSYTSLIAECKNNLCCAPALRYAKKNQKNKLCLNCSNTSSNQNKSFWFCETCTVLVEAQVKYTPLAKRPHHLLLGATRKLPLFDTTDMLTGCCTVCLRFIPGI